MARDVMAVRLHLPQIRVLEVVEDTPGALVVSVESTLLRLRCAQCGFKCRRVHDRRAKKIRDLEVSGRRTLLVWSRRRMVCDNCDSRFLEDHPAFEGALTGRLARRLVADAKVMTFSAAARRHGVHWHAVRALVDVWSALVAERRRSRRCSVLLVDETSMRKRHRYVTVIVNGDTGRTLAMVAHRSRNPRLVPIRACWTETARRAAQLAHQRHGDRPTTRFIGAADKNAVTRLAASLDFGQGGLSLRRARATWLTAHLLAGTPLVALRIIGSSLVACRARP